MTKKWVFVPNDKDATYLIEWYPKEKMVRAKLDDIAEWSEQKCRFYSQAEEKGYWLIAQQLKERYK